MKETKVIKSLQDLEPYVDIIKDCETLAVDTETTGLTRDALAVGYSLSPSSSIGIYIPTLIYSKEQGLFNPWSEKNYEYVVSFLKDTFYQGSPRLIGHNVPYDVKVIQNSLGINIMDRFKCDTALLHHTLDENPPHGLKPLAVALLDPNADSPQKDLEESVKANGGAWKASDKEFYKGAVDILGKYACYDTMLTYGLYEKLWPELEKETKLKKLWDTEVWPLASVTYELNTTGFDVDLDYYRELKSDIEANIETIEDEMYALIEDQVRDYEIDRIIEKNKFTKRSKIGKYLIDRGWDESEATLPDFRNEIYEGYCSWRKVKRNFNFGSNDDKAYLLYDVLGLPDQGTTDSGKRKVTAPIIERLAEEHAETSTVLQLLLKRNKEAKVLGTYVESILDNNENGRIYTSFNQTGTTGGRYSSSKPINFQNLPSNDTRIKKGFKANKGYKLVASDFSSLEPRAFSVVAGDKGLKEIYWDDLDFYSKVYIDTFKETKYSPSPEADNYLKKADPDKRQNTKPWALGIPYGMSHWRLAQQLNIEPEEAKKIVDSYLSAYPELKKWMSRTDIQGRKQGYIESMVGRRRRCPLIKRVYDDYGIKNPTRSKIKKIFKKGLYGFEDPIKLYLALRNEYNNIKNFQIQSLAASIVNEAMIQFVTRRGDLDAKIVSTIHDEIVLMVKEEHVAEATKLLQDCMENNRITAMLDVPMLAEPLVGANLAEVK